MSFRAATYTALVAILLLCLRVTAQSPAKAPEPTGTQAAPVTPPVAPPAAPAGTQAAPDAGDQKPPVPPAETRPKVPAPDKPAQPAPDDKQLKPFQRERTPLPKAESILAHRLTQLARLSLDSEGAPHPSQITMANLILDQSLALDNGNSELWRLKYEAAEEAKDQEAMRKALLGYLAARPNDDVAQLRLILQMGEQNQIVEKRIEYYRKLIDTKLSASLRSRLALRTAQLEREQGNLNGYGEMLRKSLQLDESNRGAALEAYGLLIKRNAGIVDRTQALLNLMAADPTNPQSHAVLAQTLLDCGGYDQALRWSKSANGLFEAIGDREDPYYAENLYVQLRCLWALGRTGEAMSMIDRLFKPIPVLGADKAPVPGQFKEPVIPAEWLSIRIAIHQAAGRKDDAAADFARLAEQLGKGAEQNSQMYGDLLWAHLLFNMKIEQAPALLEKVNVLIPKFSPVSRRFAGWLQLRQGKTDEAMKTLIELTSGDVLAAYGVVEGTRNSADKEAWLNALNEVYRQGPGTMVGIMAAQELARNNRVPVSTRECRSILQLATQIHPSIASIHQKVLDFYRLRIRPDKLTYDYGSAMELHIQLVNSSGIPLSIGENETLPSRLFVLPYVVSGNKPLGQLSPQVIDLSRKLTLAPNESLNLTVRIDIAELGMMLENNPHMPVTVMTRTILNPRLGGGASGFDTGLFGYAVSIDNIDRVASRLDEKNLVELAGKIGDPKDPAASMTTSGIFILYAPGLEEINRPFSQKVSQFIIAKFPGMSEVEQAYIITMIGSGPAPQRIFAPILEAAAASKSELVQFAMLLNQVQKVDSPVLNAALRLDGGPLKQFAEARRTYMNLPKPKAP